MKRQFLLFFLLLTATPAFSAETWTEVRSKNFTLVGNATERQIRTVAANLEQFREAFARLFPRAQANSTVSTTVILFRNGATFDPFKPRFNGRAVNTAGYFQPGTDVNFVAMALADSPPRVIYHEYAHLLTTDSARQAPAWFREGIAEFYSTFTIDAKNRKLFLGAPIREHIQHLRQNGPMALPGLFSVDHGSPAYNEREKQSAFYATSWALVHYLMLSDGGKRQPQLLRFLDLLADGTPVLQAFQSVFGVDTAAFGKSLEFYVRNQAVLPTAEYPLDELSNVETNMIARVLSEAEGEFYLGNLLLHTDRLPEAETSLQKAITLDARLAAPQASMGMLRMKQARYIEAMDYLKRAEELDPTNYLVHYYVAAAMQAQSNLTKIRPSDEQLETMHAELMKAMELAPSFVEASEMLARVNLVRNEDLSETALVLRKALDLSPGRNSLILMLATVLTQIRDGESPRPLLDQLISGTSVDSSIKSAAQGLVEYLDKPVEQFETLDLAEVRDAVRDVVQEPPLPEPPVLSDGGLRPNEVLESLTPLKPAVEGEKVQGLLTTLDCGTPVVMWLNVNGRIVKLYSDTPDQIEFLSYTNSVTSSITCGPTPPPGIPVSVTYKPLPKDDFIGVPLVVEFTGRN